MKLTYFVLFALVSISLFAKESVVSQEIKPPLLVVDKQKKEIVQGKEKAEIENGWNFSLGVLYLYSSDDSEDNKFLGLSYMILPFFGLSYTYNNFEAGFTGTGIEGSYTFSDKPFGISSGLSFGDGVEDKEYSDGYRAEVINDVNFSLGAFAYFLSAKYTYFPVKITHPAIKSRSLDAQFLELGLELPGFPILLKPFVCLLSSSLNLNMMDDNYAEAYYNYYSKDGKTLYSADGGLNSFSYSLTSNIIFNEKWMFMASFRREYFLDDAKNSPLTKNSAENTFFSMLMYCF